MGQELHLLRIGRFLQALAVLLWAQYALEVAWSAPTVALAVGAIMGRTDPLGSTILIQWLSPAAGVVFLLIALRVWNLGVRQYCSTGS